MYRSFLCYRGGSSAGQQLAYELFLSLNMHKDTIGTTYFSPEKGSGEERNFLCDPRKYLSNVDYFIMLLTKDFFDGFFVNGIANPYSVTRIEIDEVLKNPSAKFIPIIFPDYKWQEKESIISNQSIIEELWGKEAMERIVGSPPIPYVPQYKQQMFDLVLSEIKKSKKSKSVVIFDFDGTLTQPHWSRNTWESLWAALGYPVSMCEKYHKMFSSGRIDHDEWCEITEQYFKEKKLSRNHLVEVARGTVLIDDVREVIFKLKSCGISLYILSGSIKQYIETVLGSELSKCFNEIKANRFVFDDQGILDGIIGTPYDFEGKAKFVKKIIDEKGVSPQSILYVGNSFNDEFVYTTGVETLCINPMNTDFYNEKIWHNYLRGSTTLFDILPYVFCEN